MFGRATITLSIGPHSSYRIVSDIAIFVLKRDVKLQLTNSSYRYYSILHHRHPVWGQHTSTKCKRVHWRRTKVANDGAERASAVTHTSCQTDERTMPLTTSFRVDDDGGCVVVKYTS